MKVLGAGPSGTSGQCNGLSGLNDVTTLNKILKIMTVYRFQSRRMAHNDYVAVSTVGLRHTYNAIESTAYRVFGASFDINTRVTAATTSVRRNHFSSGKRKAISGVRYLLQMQF